MELAAALIVFAVVMLGLSLGVLVGRKGLRGSCGGAGCDGCAHSCRRSR